MIVTLVLEKERAIIGIYLNCVLDMLGTPELFPDACTFNSFSSGRNVAVLSGVVLNANIFQTIHRMETEIASFERGELPLFNDTNFNFITNLIDV
jgi:hypothetical protein